MKVDVRFRYAAEVVLGRKRNPERRVFEAVVPVEVPEATSAEAPVGIRYRQYGSEKAWTELRWWDDRLWKPRTVQEQSGAPHLHQSLADAVADSADPDSFHGFASNDYRHWDDVRALEDQADLRRVEESEREEREAGLRSSVSRVLAVEGLLWEETEEPAFQFDHAHAFMRDSRDSLSLETAPSGYAARNLYRLDEPEAALARLPKGSWIPTVEVLVPEAVRHRFAERQLVEVAAELAGSMTDDLKEADAPFFAAYAAVRDLGRAAKEALAVPQEEGREALGDLAGAVATAAPLWREARAKGSPVERHEAAEACRYAAAVARFEALTYEDDRTLVALGG